MCAMSDYNSCFIQQLGHTPTHKTNQTSSSKGFLDQGVNSSL